MREECCRTKLEDTYSNPFQELHGLATLLDPAEHPGRRNCVSKLEAQAVRFNLAIIELADIDVGSLGSIRKVMTPSHSIWIKMEEEDAPSVASVAEELGYRHTILAHSKGDAIVWMQLS